VHNGRPASVGCTDSILQMVDRITIDPMTRYMISFDDGTMIIPDDEWGIVGDAAHAVVRDAQAAGVWVTGGGFQAQQSTVLAVDGTLSLGAFPETKAVLGGFVVLELPSREDAHDWAARFAAACRCPQEVRVLMDDPLM